MAGEGEEVDDSTSIFSASKQGAVWKLSACEAAVWFPETFSYAQQFSASVVNKTFPQILMICRRELN